MDLILIFVILPLVTIIFSIALQKILQNPFLVGAILFAAFLLGAYLVFSGSIDAIIGAIVYGVLALITAFITRIIDNLREQTNNNNNLNTNACRMCRCQQNLLRNLNGR